MASRNWIVAAALATVAGGALGALALRARHERSSLAIRLRWIRSYDKETWENVCTGIFWSLSFLGARLDRPETEVLVRDGAGASTFELRLDRAGFSTGARRSLSSLLTAMKQSGEYRDKGALDLGRFIALTLGGSWNYYAITQVPRTLDEFRTLHDNLDRAQTFVVVNSEVAKHSRRLRFVTARELDQMAFVAEELPEAPHGSETARALAHEVFDLMPNGQLRFAVYDQRGRLIEGTSPEQSAAGKPAKCLWCHEINIFSLFRETPDLAGYMSSATFSAQIARARGVVTRYREQLHALVDFRRTQDHTQAELLYIAFMEPSAERLSREWGIDVAAARKKMAGQPTHVYDEFPFLGALYHRRMADPVAGYRSLPPPLSVREMNGAEADDLGYALH
jgi:hypothetical protein